VLARTLRQLSRHRVASGAVLDAVEPGIVAAAAVLDAVVSLSAEVVASRTVTYNQPTSHNDVRYRGDESR